MPEIDELIGKVAQQNGIRLEKDDPAFALVTLNELVLKETVKDLRAQIKLTIDEFGESVQRLDTRAGGIIAREVTQSAAHIRRELQQDISSASVQARELVRQVDAAHRRPTVAKWLSIGVFCGLVLFACGVLVGRLSVGSI